MNYFKDWLEKLKDPTRDVYERRYRLMALVSISLLCAWWILSTIFIYHPSRSVFFGVTTFVYISFYLYALRSGKVQLIAVISACSLVFVAMPMSFLYNGGVYAGAPNWFIMALLFVLTSVRGRIKTFLIAADLFIVLFFFTLFALKPEAFVTITPQIGLLNSLWALLSTASLLLSAIVFQNYMARQERDALNRKNREVEDLSRSRERFFASMSHEIRTPINTIIGLNEMNMREANLPEEVYANNRNIQGAAKLLLALINDILDMSRIESGKLDIVPVSYETGTMLSEVANIIWERADRKGLAFSVEADPTLPVRLYGDEVRVKQVLINLLGNAIKYTRKGSVKLSAQCDRLDERKARVTYRVEDTGMGIKKEALPHLFDAFRRVDQEANRNIEGTGLGLAIVKQIVDLMGGEITVDSIYTRGSVFSVSFTQGVIDGAGIGSLSLWTASAPKERDVYLQSFEAPLASLLIVDDNELNLQVESKLLAATKMKIDLAMSGRECLAMTFRQKYDVIFMDHLMPEMDGIETLKEVRAQRGGLNSETPVLALTANAGSEVQALYAKEGFDGYLVKPVTGEQLENALIGLLPADKVNLTGSATVRGGRETVVGWHRRRRQISVSCESCADLPEWLVKKYHVSVIHSLIRTEESVFYDGLDVESDSLLEYTEAQGKRARSEPPTVASYERFFAEELSKAQNVVHIALGQGVAKEYANAQEAAEAFDRVHVVDSGSFSAGAGLLALYAARLAEREDNVASLLEQIDRLKRRIRSSFIVDSTDLLAREGRVGKRAHALMKALMLHPALRMKQGALTVSRVFAGERGRYRRLYIQDALKAGEEIDASLLAVAYAGMTEEDLSEIRRIVEEKIAFRRVAFIRTSGAVALNSGRGAFALICCARSEDDAENGLFDFLPLDIGEEREPAAQEENAAAPEDEAESETASGEDAAREEETAEGATALRKLYETTAELHYDEALRYFPDEALMEKTLQKFFENIDGNADTIEQALRSEDYENFTIKVHALKSSARLIGAEELSEQARRLEEYGKFICS